MNQLNVFCSTVKVKNHIEFLDKVLEIYSMLHFEGKNRLVPSEKRILLYYVQKGLCDETLATVTEDNPRYNSNYLHGINKKLRDKGYLLRDKNNYQKFHLNGELELLRKKFVTDKAKGYIVSFKTD